MKSLPVRVILSTVLSFASMAAFAEEPTGLAPAPSAAPDGGAASTPTPRDTSTPSARSYPSSALRGPVAEADYVMGPGDVLEVTISAGGHEPQKLPVTPEGKLLLPGVGSVPVAGLTLREAKKHVMEQLHQRYRNVDVTLSLIALRRVEVHVTGAVVAPGTYIGTPMDVASSIITMAGGLVGGASRRNIQLRSPLGTSRRVDLVRYERLGDTASNPPILEAGVLFIPYEKTRVQVYGAVEVPGSYEFIQGDTIASLLEISGGLRRSAGRDSLELRRFTSDRETEEEVLPLSEETGRIAVRDGDQIFVRFAHEFRDPKAVVVVGEVKYPGPFGVTEGVDRISDVLTRAGGITENASPSEARLIRSVAAEKPDLEFERLKTVPIQDMSETEYAYFKAKSREQKGLMVLDFEKLLEGDASQDRFLRDGDRIEVPERRETITVSGTVSFPGLIPYRAGERASYYITQAGGYASDADRRNTRVIRGLTGEWESAGGAGEIVPGDEIWVPDQAEFDWWQFTQEAVRFAASVATVYLVVDRAISN